jgi:hypothetical protein
LEAVAPKESDHLFSSAKRDRLIDRDKSLEVDYLKATVCRLPVKVVVGLKTKKNGSPSF